MMTLSALLYTLLSTAGLAALFYAGWRHQTTAQAKDIYTMKWLNFVKSLAPVILSVIPGVPAILIPVVVHGIEVAETIPGATGAGKKAAVIEEVTTSIRTVNALKPGTIDETSTVAAVSQGIDATVNAVNAVHSVTK